VHVPQERSLFPLMGVWENMLLGGHSLRDRRLARRRADELAERFPLVRERRNERAGSLSGGQQKLVEIARATGVSKSTVHGSVVSLLAEGFLQSTGDQKRYSLGKRLLQLGAQAREQRALEVARTVLRSIADPNWKAHIAVAFVGGDARGAYVAAVVTVMTFFPMLVNCNAGLASTSQTDRDLMSTYAASYGATLLKLRLPAALPFIFNGLKINSTLALIGAIVAEFFGTPILGMGFRINAEVGRMNIDMVWATIAISALAGSALYGLIALVERRVTFWHPSYRGRPS